MSHHHGFSSPKMREKWYGKRVNVYLPNDELFAGGVITHLGWSWGGKRHQVGFDFDSPSLRELPCEWWKVKLVEQEIRSISKRS